MDNRQNSSLHDLFSRGSTPPMQSPPMQYQPPPPPLSHNISPGNQIDSLFQHLSSSPSDHHRQQPSTHSADYSNSTSQPNTPVMSLSDEPISSSISASNSSAADRQSALLSLLSGTSTTSSSNFGSTGAGSQQPPQVPTPPGSGASPTHNETQGKILLEQLMAGHPPRSNYSDSQRSSIPDTSSPPYGGENEYRPYAQHDSALELARGPQAPQQPINQPYQPSQPASSSQQPQQQNQPPSPRKSMFDFVSPFDALSSSGSMKKKPPPPQPSSVSSGNDESGSWTTVSAPDPKRQSVDNLLETLARAQVAPQPPSQPAPPPASTFDPYNNYSHSEPMQNRVPPPPLPPKPTGAVPNRTSSPTKTQTSRVADSPASLSGNNSGNSSNRRDKESSPGPGTRGSLRGKGRNNKNNNVNSPSPQAQNIVFDVSQPLEEIQAPRDCVKSTAIALVRQDSVFLPGSTIGATHWVAYAMTKGRIRVISRSSGDRTLLQLPPVFSAGSSVTDMAVYVNRLAGVTSDGGFVVWELPEVITDDVPGELLLCIRPANNHEEALQSVKWHPKEPDTLAVASESQVYLIDLANTPALRGQTLSHSDLHHIGQVFPVSSPLVAFDFDVLHYALATISTDSTLTIWNIQDQVPYSTHKVRGEDVPSSLTFVDGGIVVGRKNGTIFQLLSMTNKSVLSTFKFVNGAHEDPDMFGHVSYDSRIQTLWVANCRRESLIALRINLETVSIDGEEAIRGYFEQAIEFAGPKPTIHFVILTADSDPNGDEAYAACIAAKVAPGELALVAFSVHSSGVDQILVRKEWFDHAITSAPAKHPLYASPSQMASQQPQAALSGQEAPRAQRPAAQTAGSTSQVPPTRLRTPPSEDIEADAARDETRPETKGGKGKKNVNWKEKEDNGKEKNSKAGDAAINESALGQALSKEIRKTEETLHTRISRLLTKEMDKQHQRLEEARAHEQEADFARQEKILKLISSELTRNTTRVVEMAVKSEVQNSVLPSLENITRQEIRDALNDQVGRGLVDVIGQSIPVEMEKLLTRPDISGHFSRLLSNQLTPLIERHVKEAVTKTFIPVYSQQSSAMHQDLLRELRTDLHSLKGDMSGWQTDTIRSQEASIRELERSVRALSDQVKFMSMNLTGSALHHIQQQPPARGSPSSNNPQQSSLNQLNHPPPNLRNPSLQSMASTSSHMSSQLSSSQLPSSYGLGAQANTFPQQQPPVPQQWFAPPLAAPQASHPAVPPPAAHPQPRRSPSIPPDQWDEMYLSVLHTQDTNKLRELLANTDPDTIIPVNGKTLVSQAVILTLVHRLASIVGETTPGDQAFKTSLWWLPRLVNVLRPEDKLITDFIPRVVPNVQVSLNTTKQRLAIPIPGGPPTMDIARTISDIQDTLRRKVLPIP